MPVYLPVEDEVTKEMIKDLCARVVDLKLNIKQIERHLRVEAIRQAKARYKTFNKASEALGLHIRTMNRIMGKGIIDPW